MSVEKAPEPEADEGGTAGLTKLMSSAGIIAAMLVAVLLNVIVARHYKRWDMTKGGLYTLDDATLETLHALSEPTKVYVLMPADVPLTLSVEHLLDAYRAETTRLEVELADPDRRPAEFLAIQQKYGVSIGKSAEGEVVTDAAIIVVRGDKHFFLTQHDLVVADDEDDMKARPRLEQALTTAIRTVASGDRPRACFSAGHGEKQDLAILKERLAKNNFDVDDLAPARDLSAERDPIEKCTLLIVAAPSERLGDDDVARFKSFIEGGGSALIAAAPWPDGKTKRFKRLNLGGLLAIAGVKLEEDFVFELDPKLHLPRDFGEVFMPSPVAHPVTESLLKAEKKGVEVVLQLASSMTSLGGAVAPAPLLQTSERSFGMVEFFRWNNESAPAMSAGDHKGPLTVAFASELPKRAGSTAPHGPRVVVVSSASVLSGEVWLNDDLRGTALFTESAIAWLSAKPAIVDIPAKPAFMAGIHVSDDSLASIFRYVVIFMPLASALLGVAVQLRRRGSERKSARKGAGAAS